MNKIDATDIQNLAGAVSVLARAHSDFSMTKDVPVYSEQVESIRKAIAAVSDAIALAAPALSQKHLPLDGDV